MSYTDDHDTAAIIAGINVTPLVDIVLVLLIIFMVTAKIIAERGIAVDHPDTVAGDAIEGPLRITINDQRTLFVDGRPVSAPEATRLFRAAARSDPDVRAIVSADEVVPYGEVMRAIDLLELAGVRNVGLVTDKASPDKEIHAPTSP